MFLLINDIKSLFWQLLIIWRSASRSWVCCNVKSMRKTTLPISLCPAFVFAIQFIKEVDKGRLACCKPHNLSYLLTKKTCYISHSMKKYHIRKAFAHYQMLKLKHITIAKVSSTPVYRGLWCEWCYFVAVRGFQNGKENNKSLIVKIILVILWLMSSISKNQRISWYNFILTSL